MKSIWSIFLIAGVINALHIYPVLGQEFWSPPDSTSIKDDEAQPSGDKSGFGLHFQWGIFYRLAANYPAESKERYLITGDLSGLEWSRTKATWGVGVHLAADADGHRWGIKGLWRTPLDIGGQGYWQVAPGMYVFGSDNNFEYNMPGFFLETELGLARELAIVLGVEILPYKNRYLGWVPDGTYYGGHTVNEAKGTATSLHVGAKVGQLGAVAVTIMGLIAGLAVAASLSSSGGFM